MNESKIIKLRDWSYKETGETLDTYTIAPSLTVENFASLLDEFLNLGGKDFRKGKLVGIELRHAHLTIQRLAISFALGVIVGLSKQEFTDARNETAIHTAQKIARMMEDGELPLGFYI